MLEVQLDRIGETNITGTDNLIHFISFATVYILSMFNVACSSVNDQKSPENKPNILFIRIEEKNIQNSCMSKNIISGQSIAP